MEHMEPRRGDVSTPHAGDPQGRARRVRAELPGQVLRERVETARARYGTLHTLDEVRHEVAETLPRRLGYTRGAALDPIQTYPEAIPEEALLKYDDAVQSGLFSKFWVVTPAYYDTRQSSPWIVGEIAGTSVYAVVARWR